MNEHFCTEHNTKFYQHTNDNGSWFSHKKADGSYCNEKATSKVEEKPSTNGAAKTPDWDAIAEGKVRHGVAIAFIEQGVGLTEDTKVKINNWVDYIMTGK